MELKCHTCEEIKDESCFSKQTRSKRGFSYKCKKCHNEYSKTKWYPENQKKQIESSEKWKRKNKLRCKISKYKITDNFEYIEKEYLKCNNICQICKKEDINICLDHCHKTMKFRGFLCQTCNSAIAFLNEDVNILQNAIDYIENFEIINNKSQNSVMATSLAHNQENG